MESKIRHDLRHPLATISMIASTMAAFGDEVDHASIEIYRRQVVIELDELTRLVREHAVTLPLNELTELVDGFSADPTSTIAQSLDETCHSLVSRLSVGDFDGP